jgi:hypothetical protein
MSSSHSLQQLTVAFDDDHAVANAGLLLPAGLAQRLGIQQLGDELIDLGERPGAAHPGSKVLTLVHTLVAGGDCIDDADLLRAGATAAVLGHRVLAPSTLGTFLRSFTFGHVRQLDRLAEQVLTRAWAAGAGPGDAPLTVDVDSTICEVYGQAKQGAAYGYTRVLGYHPILATRADTGEVLHARMRTGRANTARGAKRFVEELAGRVRRAGACGQLTLRADSGFWSAKVLAACRRHRIRFSVTVRQTHQVRAAIAAIDEAAWTAIEYPDGGVAEVAETHPGRRPVGGPAHPPGRPPGHPVAGLALPRLRHRPPRQRRGLGCRSPPPCGDGAGHPRPQAGRGLRHCPSGRFLANAAWLVIATLAHNLLRWVAALGLGHRGLVAAKTLRCRLLALPGRLTRSARRFQLHLPSGWPWASDVTQALGRLRTLPTLLAPLELRR